MCILSYHTCRETSDLSAVPIIHARSISLTVIDLFSFKVILIAMGGGEIMGDTERAIRYEIAGNHGNIGV